jgi:tetratricopeptide (TPR) repeat protein
MAYLHFNPLRSFCLFLIALAAVPAVQAAQIPASGSATGSRTALPPPTKQTGSVKAAAYYHFSLGHLYEELAGAYGNRSEYVNKAIENYRLAIKEDPSASFLVEDIAELYRVSGRIREAVEEAQDALKTNPDDLNARRVLARIYTQQIGDAQTNRIDTNMARKAVEQYQSITAKDPKDVDSLVMLGRLQKLLDNSVDAEAAFKKALAADADNEDALTGLAGVYSDRGDSRQASELLEKLAKKNPSPRALTALASSYEQMHEYSLAADTLQKAADADPTRAEIKQYLARDLALANRLDEALKVYQDLAGATPQDSEPYLRMSQIYRQQNNLPMARQMNDKAKTIEPDNLDVRVNEVSILDAEGKRTDAINTLKGVLESTARKNYNPTERQYRAGMLERLGVLYRSGDQTEQAVDAFRQIGALDPDLAPRADAQVIDTYRLAKDYTKAQQESDLALKKYPNDRTVRLVHAQLLADQGKTDLAIGELKKSLDGKNDFQTYLSMAEVYEKSRNWTEMSKALDEADKLAQEKDDKTLVLFSRGSMYERQKKYDLAEKAFRQVLDADPTNASALNYLGYMFADQGIRLQEAQDLIKRAVNIEPNNGAFLDSLGWVYYHLNKLDEAAQQLTRSLQLTSSDPTIHDHLGDVYFKQGKIKEAIDQWQSSLKAYNTSSPSDAEPDEIAKVQKKLDSARVRLAKSQAPNQD